MSDRARMYRFRTAAQWAECLADGFDVAQDGSLHPIERLAMLARPFDTSGPASLVAADTLSGPFWRAVSNGRPVLLRSDPDENASQPFEVDAILGDGSRWLLDRGWLWGFDAASVRRYERDSIGLDLTIPFSGGVRDIALDGRGGVWALVESDSHECSVVHLDCDGCPDSTYPVPCDVRCGAPRCPTACAGLLRGKRLVLLTPDGRLVFVNTADGSVLRTVGNWRDDTWRAMRLASDGGNRIALLCDDQCDPSRWAVFVFDAEGDVLDAIIGPQTPHPVVGPQHTLRSRPADLAIAGGVLWFAADDGIWQLDASDASIARESSSTLLTPELYSPATAAAGGWLRAEIDVALPPGAVIEAEAVATGSEDVRKRVQQLVEDPSLSPSQRQTAILNLFDRSTSRVFHIVGAPGEGQPIAIPLFDVQARDLMGNLQAPLWLWLRLKFVTPPAVLPPAITELRVLYPDSSSIAQNIPAVFRGSDNDPTGFLRSLIGVIEATTQGIDDKIRRIAEYLDAGTAPAAWLDYIARWLDLPWEDALADDIKRRIVQNAGALLEWRGTRRGLELLLEALVGSAKQARIEDMTVDYIPRRLGGASCGPGARLPMLLAGAPFAPVLGVRTILGRTCLGASCDPLRCLTPRLRIEITAPRAVRKSLGTLISRLVAAYVPAGVRVVYVWKMVSPLLAAFDETEGELLDANGPARLGRDSTVGRTIVSGRGRLGSMGVDLGFPLS
jgi:phage tail-like protein